jgi:hypothetical protein
MPAAGTASVCAAMSFPLRQRSRLFAALLAAMLGVVGCGDDGSEATDAGAGRDAAALDATLPTDAARDAAADASADAALDAALDDAAGQAPDAGSPESLADTGLYAPGSLTVLAPGVSAFTPRFQLWSDGATKNRFIYLPPGASIDTSDMDHWQFPDGTKAWKEFTRDSVRVETRLLEKRDGVWRMLAFAWNEAQTEAVAAPDGVDNALGTEHDIPAAGKCKTCHSPLPDRLAGFSAIQLSHAEPGLTLQGLIADGKLSAAPAGDFALPDTAEWNTLGYLHANCGQCHNPHGGEAFDKADGMELWLTTAKLASVAETVSYTTTVGVATSVELTGFTQRIVAGNAGTSALYERLKMARGSDGAMPPLANELNDSAAVLQLETWIDGL